MTDFASRIAYVHYPHWPTLARLETMPFSNNTVRALATAGFDVDVYFCETDLTPYTDMPSTVRYLQIEEPGDDGEDIPFEVPADRRYACVFGLGQIGGYFASLLATASGSPLVYLNDEFPSNTAENLWSQREREAVAAAQVVIIPDACRIDQLYRELRISGKPFAVLPNVTSIREWPQRDWRSWFGLDAGTELFMYAGTLGGMFAYIPPLLQTVPRWPSNTAMILHSRSPYPEYRDELRDVDIPGRIVWSLHPMSEPLLNSLTGACSGTFGLYLNQGPNTETMGFSSGKLMRSIACGTPVIASRYASLSFIEEHDLGVLVDDVASVPAAVEHLIEDNAQYRVRCRRFSREHLQFDDWWAKFCALLRDCSGFEIPTPIGS